MTRHDEAIMYALEAEIADFVREYFSLENRIERATRWRQKRSHLIRYRQVAKALEIAEAA